MKRCHDSLVKRLFVTPSVKFSANISTQSNSQQGHLTFCWNIYLAACLKAWAKTYTWSLSRCVQLYSRHIEGRWWGERKKKSFAPMFYLVWAHYSPGLLRENPRVLHLLPHPKQMRLALSMFFFQCRGDWSPEDGRRPETAEVPCSFWLNTKVSCGLRVRPRPPTGLSSPYNRLTLSHRIGESLPRSCRPFNTDGFTLQNRAGALWPVTSCFDPCEWWPRRNTEAVFTPKASDACWFACQNLTLKFWCWGFTPRVFVWPRLTRTNWDQVIIKTQIQTRSIHLKFKTNMRPTTIHFRGMF